MSELSDLWPWALVEPCSASESESDSLLETLEDDPEDDVSSLSSSSEKFKELDSELSDESYKSVSFALLGFEHFP